MKVLEENITGSKLNGKKPAVFCRAAIEVVLEFMNFDEYVYMCTNNAIFLQ